MAGMNHHYNAQIIWDGNRGEGTADYKSYGREYRVLIDGRPELAGSADPTFRGDPARHNPEDLFLAAISSCHLLSYLAVCAWEGIRVVAYRDDAKGTMVTDASGSGKFKQVTLHPVVTIADPAHAERAMALHEKAHQTCFIANSCSVPIHHEARILVEGAS
jgi:organic hydroperoxide reductase OsmC/OhrA